MLHRLDLFVSIQKQLLKDIVLINCFLEILKIHWEKALLTEPILLMCFLWVCRITSGKIFYRTHFSSCFSVFFTAFTRQIKIRISILINFTEIFVSWSHEVFFMKERAFRQHKCHSIDSFKLIFFFVQLNKDSLHNQGKVTKSESSLLIELSSRDKCRKHL